MLLNRRKIYNDKIKALKLKTNMLKSYMSRTWFSRIYTCQALREVLKANDIFLALSERSGKCESMKNHVG